MAVLPKKPVDYSDMSIKSNVPRLISVSTGLTIQQVEFVFSCTRALIMSELGLGRTVRIKGLGLFESRRRPYKITTGQVNSVLKTGAVRKVFFRAEAQLEKAIV